MASGAGVETLAASDAAERLTDSSHALRYHQGQMLDPGQRPLYSLKRKQGFLSGLPSLESTIRMRNLNHVRRSASAIDDDGGASEWETIAPANELASRNNLVDSHTTPRARDFELVFHAQDILSASKSSNTISSRRNTIPGLLHVPGQRLPYDQSHLNLPTQESFCTSSSFYSDDHGFDDGFLASVLPEQYGFGPARSGSRRRPATLGMDQNISIELGGWRCSKASSSTCGDPFQYDGATYSAFLQPAAEREVSSALRRFGDCGSSIEITHPFQTDHPSSLRRNRLRNDGSFYNSEAIRST